MAIDRRKAFLSFLLVMAGIAMFVTSLTLRSQFNGREAGIYEGYYTTMSFRKLLSSESKEEGGLVVPSVISADSSNAKSEVDKIERGFTGNRYDSEIAARDAYAFIGSAAKMVGKYSYINSSRPYIKKGVVDWKLIDKYRNISCSEYISVAATDSKYYPVDSVQVASWWQIEVGGFKELFKDEKLARPGDLMFYADSYPVGDERIKITSKWAQKKGQKFTAYDKTNTASHVLIYAGNGTYYHSSSSNNQGPVKVKVSAINNRTLPKFIGFGRLKGSDKR